MSLSLSLIHTRAHTLTGSGVHLQPEPLPAENALPFLFIWKACGFTASPSTAVEVRAGGRGGEGEGGWGGSERHATYRCCASSQRSEHDDTHNEDDDTEECRGDWAFDPQIRL